MSDTNGFRTMQACDFPETTVFEKYAVKMHNRTWLTDPLAQCTTEACSACLASLSPLSNPSFLFPSLFPCVEAGMACSVEAVQPEFVPPLLQCSDTSVYL